MTIKKKSNGKWLVDIQPAGRSGKRYRKTFSTLAESKAWEAWVTTQVLQNKNWLPEIKDKRRLLDLVKTWHSNHGKQLRSGKDTYDRIVLAIEQMGNPSVYQFNAELFTEYRSKRIEQGISPATANREHAYLRAIINELIRMGIWKGQNPLASIRRFKESESELAYLSLEQISDLFAELENSKNKHVLLISEICLSTGARWGEAEGLTRSQIASGQIQFTGTKSGRNRYVPINKTLERKIVTHRFNYYVSSNYRFFESSSAAFRKAVERAGIFLPPGQMTHVLRHTFASHFMINGGNILALQRILGHQDLKTTMRYSHLSPDHLDAAKDLNPLAQLTLR